VAATILVSRLATSVEKLPVLKYHFKIELKIVFMTFSSKVEIATTLK
jgi:hypothetical protein